MYLWYVLSFSSLPVPGLYHIETTCIVIVMKDNWLYTSYDDV